MQDVEIVISSLNLKFTIRILTSHSVLDYRAYLNWVCNSEQVGVIFFIFKASLICNTTLFRDLVEVINLTKESVFCRVSRIAQSLIGQIVWCLCSSLILLLDRGCWGNIRGNWSIFLLNDWDRLNIWIILLFRLSWLTTRIGVVFFFLLLLRLLLLLVVLILLLCDWLEMLLLLLLLSNWICFLRSFRSVF